MASTRFAFLRLFAGLVVLLPSLAHAQEWGQPWADPNDRPGRVDVSASVGFMMPTDWSDLVLLGTISSASGILEQVLVRDLQIDPNEQFDLGVTYWRGRYGFRVQGGFSNSAVTISGPFASTVENPIATDLIAIDVDTYMYDVRGAIGFMDYSPERWVWPYGFVGFGGITYDLAQRVTPPLLTFIERSRTNPPQEIEVREDGTEFLLELDTLGLETVFAFNIGIGTDFRIPLGGGALGVRMELSDHIAASPVGVHIGQFRRSGRLTTDTGAGFGPVHHLRAGVGLVVQVGR